MRTVFIFGAGASRQAGAPLMSDFLDKADDLLRLKVDGVQKAKEDFERVFDAIAELQGVHAKSSLDLDNIEVVFGVIEIALMLRRLGNRTPEQISKLRDSLITLIYKTLECSVEFPVHQRTVHPPKPYDQFKIMLHHVIENQSREDPHQFTFITFNYDLCLDYTLLFDDFLPYDYGLEPSQSANPTQLLKLHGSINWGLSEKEQIVPIEVVKPHTQILHNRPFVYFSHGSTISSGSVSGKAVKGPPVIVTPTWNKGGYNSQLSNVWAHAATSLAFAQNIFIIGYSLPETDSFFRYLYALGSQSASRLRNFVVVNPDIDGEVETKFRALIGRGIERRFRMIKDNFERSIDTIGSILRHP